MLKVQHHGSEHNLDAEFCRRVSADNYVFCANGAYRNPDLGRLEELLHSRLGAGDGPNTHPKAAGAFKVWINSSSAATPVATNKDHMREVERIVSEAAAGSGGRMTFEFLDEHSFELEI